MAFFENVAPPLQCVYFDGATTVKVIYTVARYVSLRLATGHAGKRKRFKVSRAQLVFNVYRNYFR